jgi:hypothetical protein
LGHFLPGLTVKRSEAKIVQRQPAVPTGRGFVIIGIEIDLFRCIAELFRDIYHICWAERRDKEPFGGSEVAHSQKQTDPVGWTPEGGKQIGEACRDTKKRLALRVIEQELRSRSYLLQCWQDCL